MFNTINKYRRAIVAGVDESGRGALAGPVVAAAVIVDRSHLIRGVQDSKKISRKKRYDLYNLITKHYLYTTCVISVETIDSINILEATKEACIGAVNKLAINPNIVILDGNMKFQDTRFYSVIKGDTILYSIAAASIIAKVTRDRLMEKLAIDHPLYDWHKNFGYGTKYHIDAIGEYGINSQHRKSFKPVKYYIDSIQ